MRLIADGRERLDRFLARRLPEHSRTKLARSIAEGGVTVDGTIQRASFALEQGMVVELAEPQEKPPHDLTPADIPLDIVYEDDDLLIVNKPRGLASHPAASLREPSLVNALLARNHGLSTAAGDFRPGIVHRLDKDTTGLMIVAKNDFAHGALAAQIEAKTAERRYFAVVAGDLRDERFTIKAPLARDKKMRLKMATDPEGKEATTHVKRLARLDAGSLIAVRLETGRTHQIRAHLRAIGHPVLGDAIYAPKEFSAGPLQLHAGYLRLNHPRHGGSLAAYVEPPRDFLGAGIADRASLEEW